VRSVISDATCRMERNIITALTRVARPRSWGGQFCGRLLWFVADWGRLWPTVADWGSILDRTGWSKSNVRLLKFLPRNFYQYSSKKIVTFPQVFDQTFISDL